MRNCFIGHCLCTQLLYHSFTEGGVSLTTNQFEAHLAPGPTAPGNIVSRWADNVLSHPVQDDPRCPKPNARPRISFSSLHEPEFVTLGFVAKPRDNAATRYDYANLPFAYLSFILRILAVIRLVKHRRELRVFNNELRMFRESIGLTVE